MKKVYEKQAYEEFTKKYKRGKGETIKGRSSTIVRTVYKNLMPWIEFQDKDLKKIEDYFGDIRNCVYCGKKANTVDHINPLIGDKKPTGCINEPNNILPCCSDCNSKKGGNDWKCMELPSENKERLKKFTNENKEHKFFIEDVINPKTHKRWIDEIQEDIDEINQKLSILDKKCALAKRDLIAHYIRVDKPDREFIDKLIRDNGLDTLYRKPSDKKGEYENIRDVSILHIVRNEIEKLRGEGLLRNIDDIKKTLKKYRVANLKKGDFLKDYISDNDVLDNYYSIYKSDIKLYILKKGWNISENKKNEVIKQLKLISWKDDVLKSIT